jgi:hypothetical protein
VAEHQEEVITGLYAGPPRLETTTDRLPPPGQQAMVLAALIIGLLLMGLQLWLLTVALDLYLAGAGHRVWPLSLRSGLIFAGGLLVLWRLGRWPRHGGGGHRPSTHSVRRHRALVSGMGKPGLPKAVCCLLW